jgi:signal transduction histidine kinase
VLRVADDGRGYHPDAAGNGGKSLQLGLVGMRERLRPWGGTVNVASNVGGGTLVTATVVVEGGEDEWSA